MTGGYTGKYCIIDLGSRSVEIVEPGDAFYRKYLSGYGLGWGIGAVDFGVALGALGQHHAFHAIGMGGPAQAGIPGVGVGFDIGIPGPRRPPFARFASFGGQAATWA